MSTATGMTETCCRCGRFIGPYDDQCRRCYNLLPEYKNHPLLNRVGEFADWDDDGTVTLNIRDYLVLLTKAERE